MRLSSGAWLAASLWALTGPGLSIARAAEVGLGQMQGQRHVRSPSRQSAPAGGSKAMANSTASSPRQAAPKPRPSYQNKPIPRNPSSSLPNGVPPSVPDRAARRALAGGPSQDELARGPDEPELLALGQAERVLFPRPLAGVSAGWDWQADATEPDGWAPGVPPSVVPSPTESAASAPSWLGTLVLPSIVTRLDPRIVTYLGFYRDSASGQSIARAWAKKSGIYGTAVAAELRRAGLPEDLLWQSMVESAHNPAARSPVGAAGLWQFMPATGRTYGLVVDRWVDERLDPRRATLAATMLLSDLHARFGSWELALAAYNMGSAGLSRAIRKHNSNNFWTLSSYEGGLPWETVLYVPKVLALAIVMRNKSTFGLANIAPDPPLEFDTVRVRPGQSLGALARAAGLDEAQLRGLNPHLLVGRAAPRPAAADATTELRVPKGMASLVTRTLGSRSGLEPDLEVYVLRKGDTPESVARQKGVPLSTLQAVNQTTAGEVIEPGTVLLVPRQSDSSVEQELVEEENVMVVPTQTPVPSGKRRVFYRVVAGDSLTSIAKAFGVTRTELLFHNAIDTQARLQPQMTLQILVSTNASLESVRHFEEKDVRVLVAGSLDFVNYFEGLQGNERVVVAARRGDTLTSIGARYGVKPGLLERINHRSRTAPLKAGETVVVYARRGGVPASARVPGPPSEARLAPPVPARTETPPSGG